MRQKTVDKLSKIAQSNLNTSLKESIKLESLPSKKEAVKYLEARRDYHFQQLENVNRALWTLEQEGK